MVTKGDPVDFMFSRFPCRVSVCVIVVLQACIYHWTVCPWPPNLISVPPWWAFYSPELATWLQGSILAKYLSKQLSNLQAVWWLDKWLYSLETSYLKPTEIFQHQYGFLFWVTWSWSEWPKVVSHWPPVTLVFWGTETRFDWLHLLGLCCHGEWLLTNAFSRWYILTQNCLGDLARHG